MPSDFWQGLRRLTRYRYQLSRNIANEKKRFQAYAFLKCSDWKRVKPFADVFGATSAALLTEFTVGEINEMTRDQLVDLISRRASAGASLCHKNDYKARRTANLCARSPVGYNPLVRPVRSKPSFNRATGDERQGSGDRR